MGVPHNIGVGIRGFIMKPYITVIATIQNHSSAQSCSRQKRSPATVSNFTASPQRMKEIRGLNLLVHRGKPGDTVPHLFPLIPTSELQLETVRR